MLAEMAGSIDEARSCVEQSLAFKRELGDARGVAWAQDHLSRLALRSGDVARAADLQRRALQARVRMRFVPGVLESIAQLGDVAAAVGQHERCVRLHPAVSALRKEHGLSRATAYAHHCMAIDAMSAGLSPAQHDVAWASGSVLDQDDAVALALEDWV